jgi:ADP-ribosylglycohydrolase
MTYPKIPDYNRLIEQITLYSQLKHEYGAKRISPILSKAEKDLKLALSNLKKLPIDKGLAKSRPNYLMSIRKLRPRGKRRLWQEFDKTKYQERCEGALLGRMAGCTLGAPVEFWSIDRMKAQAKENGDAFPPVDYWSYVPSPTLKRYRVSPREAYTRKKMNGVPVDDDIAYTLLGLLVVEDFGPDFTIEDIGRAWIKYLPYAATAEDIALKNLHKGVPAAKAGQKDNPFREWIGASIRSDPWGYMAPGWPERAAEMAYRDSYLSHRREGIYGAMYFAAAIAAAFSVDHPVKALRIGLGEIPKACAMSKTVRWALKMAPQIRTYQQARDAVEEHFKGMSPVHTLNNACLTIWGLTIGGTDITKVIGETVAMGMDNDCTAATAGSIVGAIIGKKGIPGYWYKHFNNTVRSYLIGKRSFTISGLVKRFTKQAALVQRSAN